MKKKGSRVERPAGYKRYPIEMVHEKFREWEKLGSITYRKENRIFDTFDGLPVKTWSQRYTLFLKSTKCAACGLEANCYILEKMEESRSYHFNLYHVDKNGKETLFTKDHIRPASKGGRNIQGNYQTMCAPCNFKKSDKC